MTYHFQLQQDLHNDITEDNSAVLNIKIEDMQQKIIRKIKFKELNENYMLSKRLINKVECSIDWLLCNVLITLNNLATEYRDSATPRRVNTRFNTIVRETHSKHTPLKMLKAPPINNKNHGLQYKQQLKSGNLTSANNNPPKNQISFYSASFKPKAEILKILKNLLNYYTKAYSVLKTNFQIYLINATIAYWPYKSKKVKKQKKMHLHKKKAENNKNKLVNGLFGIRIKLTMYHCIQKNDSERKRFVSLGYNI
ncbi:hypothetical protein AGLY_004372 [Aphis glycines]|uniref:Uncharacterized protein n=1 Tax=Aphis glycines TaxID=307491 RepID=A0A6G0U0C3_APHGL|nr:hypothetical protein AGLY_004372 [Aphis glycines]